MTLEIANNPPIALEWAGPDFLRTLDGLELRPVRDRGGRITGLTVGAGRLRDLSFVKR